MADQGFAAEREEMLGTRPQLEASSNALRESGALLPSTGSEHQIRNGDHVLAGSNEQAKQRETMLLRQGAECLDGCG